MWLLDGSQSVLNAVVIFRWVYILEPQNIFKNKTNPVKAP